MRKSLSGVAAFAAAAAIAVGSGGVVDGGATASVADGTDGASSAAAASAQASTPVRVLTDTSRSESIRPVALRSSITATGSGSGSIGVRTVKYGSDAMHTMDVYTPAAAVGKTGRKLGTVFFVHGGAWVGGDKDQFVSQGRQLARLGYVSVSINYRTTKVAAWPAQRDDAFAALRYLRKNAARFNVSTSRMLIAGSSAGAHIAASVATWGAGESRFKGLLAMSGPLDPRKVAADPTHNLDFQVTDRLLRCLPTLCPSRYIDAAPITRLTADDPRALLVASRDEWVDPQNSVEFYERAREVGAGARMLWLEGDRHGSKYWADIWKVVRAWIKSRIGPATG